MIEIKELKELEVRVKKCAECDAYSLDSCRYCRNHRVSDSEVYEVIKELIEVREGK